MLKHAEKKDATVIRLPEKWYFFQHQGSSFSQVYVVFFPLSSFSSLILSGVSHTSSLFFLPRLSPCYDTTYCLTQHFLQTINSSKPMLTTEENNRSSCLSRHKFLLLQQYAYNPAYGISTNFDDNERCWKKQRG